MLRKNLRLCFSRIHCLPTSFSHPLTLEDEQQQLQQQQQQQQIMKRFNSLYDLRSTTDAGDTSSSFEFSEDSEASEPDFSSVVASHRFFVSTPGSSNSILDSSSKPPSAVVGGGVPVRKYSPDPFVDFRESMEEMVRARRELRHPTAENESTLSDEWEYLHELLMCYLALNPKRAHKFIIGAFTDLLLSSSASGAPTTTEIFV